MRPVYFFLFLFGISLASAAQSIDTTLARYAEKYTQEKTYLHYDKAAYGPGETIWFKAYMMNGIFPADDSKTLYVDFTDQAGKVLSHGAYPIVEGGTNGQFDIPANYTGDYIHVKAYTRWMLNFDSSFLYNKDLRILSAKKTATATKAVPPSLQFFPEGGDMITEVANKIAFKADDQWGQPVKIKGIITDSKGGKVDSIRVAHDGMGFFFIVPLPGETYTAKWKDDKGKEYSTPLPKAKTSGIALQVSVAGDKRNVIINTPAGSPLKIAHVIGTMNQQQAFKVSKDLSSGSAKLVIPVKDLPSGVLTVTVFDETWKPLAERITFVNNQEFVFKPEMNVDHWGLSKRARNRIDITIPDSMIANLSVSVTDLGIESDSNNTIISHMLLSSELKGRIYKPAYYFSANTDKVAQDLDLVMLTHGWRRFRWDEIAQGKLPAIKYPRDTSYIVLSGRVYGVSPTQLRDAGDIILLIKQKKGESQTLLMPINKDGYFEDPSLILFDSLKVYYQLNKKKGLGDASVRFMESLLPALSANKAADGLYNNLGLDTTGISRHLLFSDESAKLLQQYEGKVLDNVVVKGRVKSKVEVMDEKYTSALFRGDGVQFDLTDNTAAMGAMDILTYLQGRVAGLQISSGNPPSLQWRGGAPQLYLDEMQTDAQMITSVPVSDIAFVKVFRPPFMGGFGGANGAIAIYTRRGDDVKAEPGKGLANNMVTGYAEIKQFYSPNYDTFKPENEKRDIRTTLYWNPQVRIDPKTKKASLTFYNNDVSEAFRVVIEGMTQDGRLAHIEQTME